MFLQILCVIFGYDLWFYTSHIILHKWLYSVHTLRHTIANPIFTDAYVGYSFEGLFQGLGVFFPYLFMEFYLMAFIIALILINMRSMLRQDVRSIWLIGNHHLLHDKHPQYNYGEYWLDWLCGTRYVKEEEYEYGIMYI
jgi:sterol desaturase/sphingolipid hydroxylase (fatty acid hydroxylase superfamily)